MNHGDERKSIGTAPDRPLIWRITENDPAPGRRSLASVMWCNILLAVSRIRLRPPSGR